MCMAIRNYSWISAWTPGSTMMIGTDAVMTTTLSTYDYQIHQFSSTTAGFIIRATLTLTWPVTRVGSRRDGQPTKNPLPEVFDPTSFRTSFRLWCNCMPTFLAAYKGTNERSLTKILNTVIFLGRKIGENDLEARCKFNIYTDEAFLR